MKLIGMREFVLEQIEVKQSTSEFKETIVKYAKFLSQPLTLGMFVPVDENGNVLEEPEQKEKEGAPFHEPFNPSDDYTKYQQAKERVIFEGFTVDEGMLKYNDRDTPFITRGNLVFYDGDDIYQLFTIEDIVFYGEDPELNQQAIKQIGG